MLQRSMPHRLFYILHASSGFAFSERLYYVIGSYVSPITIWLYHLAFTVVARIISTAAFASFATVIETLLRSSKNLPP